MMKRLFILLILLIGVFWIFDQKTPSLKTKLSSPVFKDRINESNRKNTHLISKTSLTDQLQKEALNIGKVDSNPAETEKKLQDWARSLNLQELRELAGQALNLNLPQDTRFLAVMLLGWSEKLESLNPLMDIALAEIDPYLSPNRSGDFERILRMQALDGILNLPLSSSDAESSLTTISSRSSQSVVVDRAQRGLWFLRGQAQKPAEQDHEALTRILKRP